MLDLALYLGKGLWEVGAMDLEEITLLSLRMREQQEAEEQRQREQTNWRLARLMSLIANVFGNKTKADDFMPGKPPISDREAELALQAWAANLNAGR
jgi:hypothetical protein